MAGPLAGLSQSNVMYGRIYFFLMALPMWVFGVDIFALRAVSLLCGLGSLGLLYLLVRDLVNKKVALCTVVIFGITNDFIRHSHDMRPEMMQILFTLGALYVFVRAGLRGSRALYLISGLLAGLSLDIHLNGMALLVGFLIAVLAHFRWRVGTPALHTTLVGILCGLFWWWLIHFAVDPGLFILQWREYWGTIRTAPIFSSLNPLNWIQQEAQRYIQFFWHSTMHLDLIFLGIFILAIVTGILRRSQQDNFILWMLGGSTLGFTLLLGSKNAYYVILLYPYLVYLTARWFCQQNRKRYIKVLRCCTAGIFILYALVLDIGVLIRYREAGRERFQGFIQAVQRHIPKGSVVLAQPVYWFGFVDQPFYTYLYLTFIPYGPQDVRERLGSSFEEAILKLGVDYLIVDDLLVGFMIRGCKMFSEEGFKDFIQRCTSLVGQVRDPFYGGTTVIRPSGHIVQIYRIKG
jgi:4-amino-4-deoxy-L-arabinose transferase-like glycosyltransferase